MCVCVCVCVAGGVSEAAVGGETDEAVPAGEPHRYTAATHPQAEGHHSQ